MTVEVKREAKSVRPINRLQTVYAVRALTDKQYADTQKAKEEGKPIAWCMVEPWHRSFLNAMDIESVYPESYASVCSAAGAAQPYLDRSESEGFPSSLCGYAQNTIGYADRLSNDMGGEIPPEAPRGGMPKPDLIIGNSGGTCDARYKWFQAMGRYLDCPIWITESPSPGQKEGLMPGVYERDNQFVIEHLKQFVDFLEKLFKKKFDWDKFAEDVDHQIAMNDVWYHVTDELRMARPGPMHARDHYSAMQSVLMRTTDPMAVKKLFENMGEEIQHRIDNGIAGINFPEKYRVAHQGLGPWSHMRIFDNLAAMGWNFPREGYHPRPPIDLSDVKDPLEKLVRYSRRSVEWGIDNDFEPEEAAEIKKEIMEKGFSHKPFVVDARDYQLDGVLMQTAVTCRMTSCRTGLTIWRLMNEAKVPVLLYYGDMIDERLTDVDELLRRCEAFEETMDHYKEERKKAGMSW